MVPRLRGGAARGDRAPRGLGRGGNARSRDGVDVSHDGPAFRALEASFGKRAAVLDRGGDVRDSGMDGPDQANAEVGVRELDLFVKIGDFEAAAGGLDLDC